MSDILCNDTDSKVVEAVVDANDSLKESGDNTKSEDQLVDDAAASPHDNDKEDEMNESKTEEKCNTEDDQLISTDDAVKKTDPVNESIGEAASHNSHDSDDDSHSKHNVDELSDVAITTMPILTEARKDFMNKEDCCANCIIS